MSDVLARLMRWMETSDIDDADVVLRDAITEIAGLRARLDERRRMPTLTDAEREAVDRLRIAFRDMDHNDMTMQQIEDYESICDLLERTK